MPEALGDLLEESVLVAAPTAVWERQHTMKSAGPRARVGLASGGADALEQLESGCWTTLVLSANLPDLDCFEVAALASQRFPGLHIRFLDDEIPAVLSAAEEESVDERECRHTSPSNAPDQRSCASRMYSVELPAVEPLPGMVGTSELMQHVYAMARRIAPRATTVLITGATGTGKELVARALHQLSPRSARSFSAVNCAAIPEALFESELFGHTRGAFTGAVQFHGGRVASAQGGTLFLDEVGELPLSMQAKLLRFIEQGEVQRLGSSESSKVDVRVVAASNADLVERVQERAFREDLFYRLSVFCLELPALHSRVADILPLARHFLEMSGHACPQSPLRISPNAARLLTSHHWPGNVRELRLVIERACILAEGRSEILPEHISFPRSRKEQPIALGGVAV